MVLPVKNYHTLSPWWNVCALKIYCYNLAETVAQNNLALRQQLGLVIRWKQQSEAQLQEQRQQAAQGLQQLSSLQQENATLKAHLASVKVSISYLDERIHHELYKLL